ncbi:hypothetical protein [Clavibacter zhangzhiyongii]|uniref:hypothetical protein n=1 Tax=Clavibacter zhangzhiyongii TaxID=2768071 RepID=UPI0039E1D414
MLVVAAAVIAGIPGLLIALGVVALVAGLIPLIRRGSAWIPGVRSRATGGVAAGLALVLIAGGAVASTVPTPTATRSPTRTPSRSPTPVPCPSRRIPRTRSPSRPTGWSRWST